MKNIIIIIIIVLLGFFIYKEYGKDKTQTPASVNTEIQGTMTESVELENRSEAVSMVEEGNYTVVTSESNLTWEGRMGQVKSHIGSFGIETGALMVDAEGSATGGIVIDMNDLQSDSGDGLNDHLKSEDFFETSTYPTAEFTVTGMNQTSIMGDLMIKGQTHPVEIPVTISMDGENRTVLMGDFNLDRAKWNIRYGSTSFIDNLGDKAIDDVVPVMFKIVLEKQA